MKQASGRPISSEDLVGVPGAKQAGLIISQNGEKIELGVDLPVLDTLIADPAEWLERRHAQLIAQSGLRGQDETILKVTSLGSIIGGFILNTSPLGIAALCLGVVGYSSGVVIGRRLTGRFNLSPIGYLSLGDALDLVTADTRGDALAKQTDDETCYLNDAERSELWLIDHHSGLVAEALSRFKPSARLLAYLKIRRMARRRRTVPQPQEIVNAVGTHRLLKAEQGTSPRQQLSPSTALSNLTGEPRPPAAPLPLKPAPQKALRLQGAESPPASREDAPPEPVVETPLAPPPDPNAGLRIGFPESPVDIAQQIGARLSNLIIFAKPRTGKGFTVSRASRHVQQVYEDCEVYVIDPRDRPCEKEYWLHIPDAQRLHFDISGFTYNAQEIVNRIHAFTVRFEESPARRKLLIIDEFKMLVRKLGPYAEVKRLIDYVISLSSSGSVGQAHESLGRFAWLCSQDPQLSSLGFRNAGDRGSFEIFILFDGEKGIQMHVDLKNTGLIPNLPDWGQLQGLAGQSESGRFFYSTATDSFRSIPVYEVNNVRVSTGKAHRRTRSQQTFSSKAAKLQHLNNSLAAPPTSPAYQSNEDLFTRIDSLWKNDDLTQGTDVIDQAISYLSESNKKERKCLGDLLETIKRKALKSIEKGEAMQISIREISGLSWAKNWSEEQQLLSGRKREEIEPWLQLAVQLGFLSRVSDDDYFIHLS